MNTVYIFRSRIDKILTNNSLENILAQLPPNLQSRIKAYKLNEDRARALLGKLLLQKGAKELYQMTDVLPQLQYEDSGKPYLDLPFHFNISHAGDWVICAFSQEKVGIDIEQVIENQVLLTLPIFNLTEKRNLENASNSFSIFFQYWTAKEAVLKCNGVGLVDELGEVSIELETQTAVFQENNYHIHTFWVEEKYCVTVAMLSDFEIEVRN